MAPTAEKAGPVAGADPRNSDLAINSENNLSARQAQYLSQVFAVAPATAALLADLGFDAGCPR